METKNVGPLGEQIAADYLKKKGYKVKERNYWLANGEIDIIARQGKELVFVEVKTILGRNHFQPEDHLDISKQQQLIKLSQSYLKQNNKELDCPYRIDLVAISLNQTEQTYRLKHYPNILEDRY